MSLRDFFKRYLPEQHTFREHRHIRLFGTLLHDHSIWRLTRRSVAGAVGIGVFIAFVPIFGQMLVAAALAIYFRINLPIAVVFTWISNPFTFAPMLYVAYRLGSTLLDLPIVYTRFRLDYEWFLGILHEIWLPLLVGGVILGAAAGTISYYLIHMLWRILLLRKRDEQRTTRPYKRRPKDDE